MEEETGRMVENVVFVLFEDSLGVSWLQFDDRQRWIRYYSNRERGQGGGGGVLS